MATKIPKVARPTKVPGKSVVKPSYDEWHARIRQKPFTKTEKGGDHR